DPGRGRTKTGRLWGYAVDDQPWGGITPPAVVYLYAEDRKGEHPAALQVDGHSGFKRLLAGRPSDQIKLAFCWAHPWTACWAHPWTALSAQGRSRRFRRSRSCAAIHSASRCGTAPRPRALM
ncbi:MAG: putative transposase, partial [Geminicoccaceae bacterium]|nr:putative transposase [Geminicoccaceae bacterium]